MSYKKYLVSGRLPKKYDAGKEKHGYLLEATPQVDPDNQVLEAIG